MATILFVVRNDSDMTEPMNIMLLSALAKKQGWKTKLLILKKTDIVEGVRKEQPDLVAFSVITGSQGELLAANRESKKAFPQIKTVMGGPFVTFNPGVILEHPLDAIGVGECDEAWPELLRKMASGKDFSDIRNIVTPENARTVLKRNLSKDRPWKVDPGHIRARFDQLDSLPFMDRELLYQGTAFERMTKRTMMAGRGCPFSCTYCFEHSWNAIYRGKGHVLQRLSVARLCAELKDLKERWDTRFIKFYDDVFPAFENDLNWLEEFAQVYPREVGLPFHCLIRAELASDKVIALLKKAGIASLSMSIEAGNPFVRQHMLRREMSDKIMRDAFAICRKYRLPTFANTILGIPAPVLPNPTSSDFDKHIEGIKRAADLGGGGKKAKAFKKSISSIQGSLAADSIKREALMDLLKAEGIRKTRIEYDCEALRVNIDYGVSFGEFPVFFPYQGTDLGVYSVEAGYFAGDYDSLHASYQTQSPLGCFDSGEKKRQQNLALLGTVVLEFTGSFNPVIRFLGKPFGEFAIRVLSRLPLTPLYLQLYSMAKSDMHMRRIYPMHRSMKERVRIILGNVFLDRFKQMGFGARAK